MALHDPVNVNENNTVGAGNTDLRGLVTSDTGLVGNTVEKRES